MVHFFSLLISLRNWLNKNNKKNSIQSHNIDKEKRILEKLGKTDNIFERSYFQYQCQMYIEGISVRIIYNLVAVPLFILLLIFYLIDRLFRKIIVGENIDIVFDIKDDMLLLPEEIDKEKVQQISFEGGYLEKNDWIFFKKHILKKYPLSPYFITKNFIKMIKYRGVITKHHPSIIIVCNEYSFTSSFLTAYCNFNNLQHINIMHGEKVFFIRDSYFQFDKCYIWDHFYSELFIRLNAEITQFKVAIPEFLLFSNVKVEKKNFDFTYYLQNESISELKIIHELLVELQKGGYKVRYRPHPKYYNKYTKKIFNDIIGEDTNYISIANSILTTKNVISRYSTVLFQAYLNGINVVIDDMSIPREFEQLKQRGYIMLNKPHKLLSDYIKDLRYKDKDS